MPELRTDWLTGRTVLVAENRALRPNDFAGVPAKAAERGVSTTSQSTCPFCAGHEDRTPTPVFEKRDEAGNWQIRVVPNMFPAVELPSFASDAVSAEASTSESTTKTFQASPATGVHEVIIESAQHIDRLSELSKIQLHRVLEVYAERLRHWRADGRFQYGLVFKNQGQRAGASIAHLHSQLIALPFVPAAVEAEHLRAAEAFTADGNCPYCQLINRELAAGDRIVLHQDGFLAFCPFVSLQPYEIWLMPIEHPTSFEAYGSEAIERLTKMLHHLVRKLEGLVPDAAYNLLLRTAPWTAGCDAWSHWRFELLPRINAIAGFEMATEVHINHVPPEQAARRLQPR
jgi:UDPglucose--hexose-1-phosphate uridylyltransferase